MRQILTLAVVVWVPASALPAEGRLRVILPPDATLTVNGVASRLTGRERVVRSQNLRDGEEYWYDMEVKYPRDGKPVTEQRSASVRSGRETVVRFDLPDERTATGRLPRTRLAPPFRPLPAPDNPYLRGAHPYEQNRGGTLFPRR